MSSPLTQEQKSAIMGVFKSLSSRIVKQFPKWDFATAKSQFSALQTALSDFAPKLGSLAFAIEVTQQDDTGKPLLTDTAIHQANASHITMLKIGSGMRIISAKKLGRISESVLSPLEMSAASAKSVILLREANNLVTVFAKGFIVGRFDLLSPDIEPATAARFGRRAEDYQHSILDHYEEAVRFCQSTDHWKDRQRRVLFDRRGTQKTEHIFHHSLHFWLEKFLQAQVVSQPKFTTKDELDIFICAPNGRTYLIEVKWMGTNGKTTYKIKDFAKGVKQLGTYLKRHTKIFHGTLVAYDGRPEATFQSMTGVVDSRTDGCKRLDACEGVPVPARGSCIVLFLDSRTASDQ